MFAMARSLARYRSVLPARTSGLARPTWRRPRRLARVEGRLGAAHVLFVYFTNRATQSGQGVPSDGVAVGNGHVLVHRHRGFDAAVAGAAGRDATCARAPRRDPPGGD